MHLSGELADWSTSDLLQIMQVTKKTGSLDIEGERSGRIHFRDGSVTGAELAGTNGSYIGEDRGGVAEVVYVLSKLSSGNFSVGPADGPERPGWEVADILADVTALETLEGEVVDAGLFDATGVRLVEEISEALTIQPEEWSALVTLVRPFTLDDLEAQIGRGGAVRVFHTLHKLGVAEAYEEEQEELVPQEEEAPVGRHDVAAVDEEGSDDEEESQWLDRVAGKVTRESEAPTWREEDSPEEDSPEDPSEALDLVRRAAEARRKAEQADPRQTEIRGVSAPASTTLTDGVYDEIRRLRSRTAGK